MKKFPLKALLSCTLPMYLGALLLSSLEYLNFEIYIFNMGVLTSYYIITFCMAFYCETLFTFSTSSKVLILVGYLLTVYILLFKVGDYSLPVLFIHTSGAFFLNFGRFCEMLFQDSNPPKKLKENYKDPIFRLSYTVCPLDLHEWSILNTVKETKTYCVEIAKSFGKACFFLICSSLVVNNELTNHYIRLLFTVMAIYATLEIVGVFVQIEFLVSNVKVTPFNKNIFDSLNIADFWTNRWDTGLQRTLYYTAYKPSKYFNLSKKLCSFNTFLVSGLLHVIMFLPFGLTPIEMFKIISYFLSQLLAIKIERMIGTKSQSIFTWIGILLPAMFLVEPIVNRLYPS